MHPYVIDRIVEERHEELVRLARANGDVWTARRARAARPTRAGRAVGAVALAVSATLGRSRLPAPLVPSGHSGGE